MRYDVVNIGRLHITPFLHALYTQGMRIQIPLPGFLPFAAVASTRRAPIVLRMQGPVLLAVFCPIWDKRSAAGMSAWYIWS